MLTRFKAVWQRVYNSLWALPLLMVLCAVATATVVLTIPLFSDGQRSHWLFSGNAKRAPDFISNLVSAMITMGTLVISITMVVLTLAAQQLGSRLIRSFMADRRTQASIGLFVSTTVYLLLVQRSVYEASDNVPNLAVTIGTALVLLSVTVLPLFVHHLARAIIADTMIERVGQALESSALSMSPPAEPELYGNEAKPAGGYVKLRVDHAGYIQTIDYRRLVAMAKRLDAIIAIDFRAGNHVIAGTAVGRVSPPPDHFDGVESEVNASVVVGNERTAIEDLEYPLWQLVEVALRALSPGVNDPHTAVACIDRLGSALRTIMLHGSPPRIWRDDENAVRVIARTSTFEGVVDAAFNEIRQAGKGYPAILMRVAETLAQLAEQAPVQHHGVLAKHVGLLLATGRQSIDLAYDLKALEERADRAMRHLVLPDPLTLASP